MRAGDAWLGVAVRLGLGLWVAVGLTLTAKPNPNRDTRGGVCGEGDGAAPGGGDLPDALVRSGVHRARDRARAEQSDQARANLVTDGYGAT